MAEPEPNKSSKILDDIIKRSLFTKRQIEIIMNQKGLAESKFSISRGAYYRQVAQSRDKLAGFYYSVVLLQSLGVLLPDDMDVMSKLSEQLDVIKNSDVFPEKEAEITSVVEMVIRKACGM